MKKIIPLSLFVLLIGCGENYSSWEECILRERQKFQSDAAYSWLHVNDYCETLNLKKKR